MHSKNNGTDDLANCDVEITPACIRALYQIPELDSSYVPNPDNALGIFEEGDYYAQEDLDLFFANYTNIPKGTAPTPAFIDGAEAPNPDYQNDLGGESDLDFELAYPIIYPQKITLFQTDDYNYATEEYSEYFGFFNTLLDAIDGVGTTDPCVFESMLIKRTVLLHILSLRRNWG